MYQYLQLKIGDLLVSHENPRYESVEHQREAIEVMLLEQKEKLVELAKHILEHGLSPIDIVLVEKKDNLWIVREGNRRITALKLMATPTLVPDNMPKIQREFKGLSAKADPELFEGIPCVFSTDEKEAREWIRLKHTGENSGSGIVSWNAQQSGRFQLQTSDKPDARMVFLDGLKK